MIVPKPPFLLEVFTSHFVCMCILGPVIVLSLSLFYVRTQKCALRAKNNFSVKMLASVYIPHHRVSFEEPIKKSRLFNFQGSVYSFLI